MQETLYERTLRELPEKLIESELNEGKKLLREFLYENQNEYYMLMVPYPKQQYVTYNTLFKVEEDAIEGIFNFIQEDVGTIQKIETVGNRIDFYCNNQMYSLFGYDDGVIAV